jgi:hypothetical protein
VTALQRMLRTSDGLARARRREMARGAAAMMHRGQDSSDESQTEDEDEQQQQQQAEEEGEETALERRSRLVRGALFGEVVRSSTCAAGVPGRQRGDGGGEGGGGGGGGGAIVVEPLDRTLPARLRDCALRLRLHGASRGSAAQSLEGEEEEEEAERTVRGGGGESFLCVHWVAVPKATRARRVNRRRWRRRRRRVGARGREQRRGQP